MKRSNHFVKLLLSIILTVALADCSNIRFIKRNVIARFGEDYRPCHPLLKTSGGAYFLTRNDTVFPSALLVFNEDGSLFKTVPYTTRVRYLNNDSLHKITNHVTDQELGSVLKYSDKEERSDYSGLHSTSSTSIYTISNDTIITQSFGALYGRSILGIQSWHYSINKYFIESDSIIILISERIYYDYDQDQDRTVAKRVRYVFHETPYPVSTYDKYDYRNCYPWLWGKREEWKAWKKANGRK